MLCAGCHITLLYLWQIEALRAADLKSAAELIGMFVMKPGGKQLAEQARDPPNPKTLNPFFTPQAGLAGLALPPADCQEASVSLPEGIT